MPCVSDSAPSPKKRSPQALSSVSATTFTPTDNGNGTYDVDVALTGTPCGATAQFGTLFTLDVAPLIANGTGTIDILDVQLRDCEGSPVAAAAGGPSDIAIDTIVPAGVTNLVFNQVVTGNPAGNVTEVEIVQAFVNPNFCNWISHGFGYDDCCLPGSLHRD